VNASQRKLHTSGGSGSSGSTSSGGSGSGGGRPAER